MNIDLNDNDNNDNNDNHNVVYKHTLNKLKYNVIENKHRRHNISFSIYHYHYYKLKTHLIKFIRYHRIKQSSSSLSLLLLSSSSSPIILLKLRSCMRILLNNTSRKKTQLAYKWRYKRILSIVFGAWLYVHKEDSCKENESIATSVSYYNNNTNNKFLIKMKKNYYTNQSNNNNNRLSTILYVLYRLNKYIKQWKSYRHIQKYKQLLVSYSLYINTNHINKYRYFNKLLNKCKRKKSSKHIRLKRIRKNDYYSTLRRKVMDILRNFYLKKKYDNDNNSMSCYVKNVKLKFLVKLLNYKDSRYQSIAIIRNVKSRYIERTLTRYMKVLWEHVDTRRGKKMNEKYESLIFYQLKMRRSIQKWNDWFRNRNYNYTNIMIQHKKHRASSLRRALVCWLRFLKRRYMLISINDTSNNHRITYWRHKRIAMLFTIWLKRLKSKRYQRLRAKRFYHNYNLKGLKEAMRTFKHLCSKNKDYKRFITKALYLYESTRYSYSLSNMLNVMMKRRKNEEIIVKAILFWKLWRQDNYIQRFKDLVAHRRNLRRSKLLPEVASSVKEGAVESIIKDGVALWQANILFVDKSERSFKKLNNVFHSEKENKDLNRSHVVYTTPISLISSSIPSIPSIPSIQSIPGIEYSNNSMVKVAPRTLPEALSLPIPLHSQQQLSIPLNITPLGDCNKFLYDSNIKHSDVSRDRVLLEQQQQLERKKRIEIAKDIIQFVSQFAGNNKFGINLGELTTSTNTNHIKNDI